MAQDRVEETGVSTITGHGGEIQAASMSAAAAREIEVRVTLAKRFLRVEDQCFQKVSVALARPEFAALAYYEMPAFGKKGKPVPVRSVHLAREMMRCWTNLASGLILVAEDESSATVRGFCWDMETNTYRFEDVGVPRLVQKRQYDNEGNHTGTIWVKADANDFRRLCANLGGRAERNSIFRTIGAQYVEAAVELAKATQIQAVKGNLSKAVKGLLLAYERIGIFVGQIEQYIGCKISEATAEQIAELEGIGRAIKTGEARWSDYQTKPANEIVETIDPATITRSADENRGHDAARAEEAR